MIGKLLLNIGKNLQAAAQPQENFVIFSLV